MSRKEVEARDVEQFKAELDVVWKDIRFLHTETAAVAEWLRAWNTLTILKLRCAGGRELKPRPGQYTVEPLLYDHPQNHIGVVV